MKRKPRMKQVMKNNKNSSMVDQLFCKRIDTFSLRMDYNGQTSLGIAEGFCKPGKEIVYYR